jgi:peptidoglycan/LPS O-acetylase OafA/YrhL
VLAWSSQEGDTVGRFYQRRAARILPRYWIVWLPGVVYAIVVDGGMNVNQIPSLPRTELVPPEADPLGRELRRMDPIDRVLLLPDVPLLLPTNPQPDKTGAGLGTGDRGCRRDCDTSRSASARTAGADYWAIYLLPATRFFEFSAGMTLALLLRKGVRLAVPVAVRGMLAFAVSVAANWLPLYTLLVAATVVPFLLLLASAVESDLQGRRTLPMWKPIVQLGEWSFAFYLMHLIVLGVVIAVTERTLGMPWWATTVVGFILGMVLAAILYEYVEKPLEKRLRPKPLNPALPQESAVVSPVG